MMSKTLFSAVSGLITVGLFYSFAASGQNGNYIRNTENGGSPGFNNTVAGFQSGLNLTGSAVQNVLIGSSAGQSGQDLRNTILMGSRAGYSLQQARYQIMIGDSAGFFSTTPQSNLPGYGNIYIGSSSGAAWQNAVGRGNVFVGHGTGSTAYSSSIHNVLIGNGAGMNIGGTENSFMGDLAGATSRTSYNTYLGASAGIFNSQGSENVFVGRWAGYSSHHTQMTVFGSRGVFVGNNAGEFHGGSNNVFIGYQSGRGTWGNSTGNMNVGMGYRAAPALTSGNENTILGGSAGEAITTGFRNTMVGSYSGRVSLNSSLNVYVGSGAGQANESGNANVMIGERAGSGNKGSRNVFVGHAAAAYFGGSGTHENVFIGDLAAEYNAGSQNVAIGKNALWYQTYGSHNVAIGNAAATGTGPRSYSNTVIIGDSAGYNNFGDQNVFLGQRTGTTNTSGGGNTYLGYGVNGVGAAAASLRNATAIGANAVVGVSDGFILGDTTNAKVGIGTAYPNQRLTIRGNMNFLTASNLRFDNAPFLDINPDRLALGGEKGEFPVEITSSLRYKIASENQWADYVFAPSFRKLPLKEVAVFIQQNGHLPGIPSAKEVVLSGVDAAQMDAKLLAQIEQLTLHAIEQKSENDQLKAENKALKEQFSELLRRVERLERK
jgi:hypothetical protein